MNVIHLTGISHNLQHISYTYKDNSFIHANDLILSVVEIKKKYRQLFMLVKLK